MATSFTRNAKQSKTRRHVILSPYSCFNTTTTYDYNTTVHGVGMKQSLNNKDQLMYMKAPPTPNEIRRSSALSALPSFPVTLVVALRVLTWFTRTRADTDCIASHRERQIHTCGACPLVLEKDPVGDRNLRILLDNRI